MGVENNKVRRDFVKTHEIVRNIALNAKVFTLPTTNIYSVCVTALNRLANKTSITESSLMMSLVSRSYVAFLMSFYIFMISCLR